MKLQLKNKEETKRKKLLEIQKPTSKEIEEQVSVEVDNHLNDKGCESALKKPSSKKKKERKTKSLAHAIAQSTNRTTNLGETLHKTILESVTEETGSMEHGEILLVCSLHCC